MAKGELADERESTATSPEGMGHRPAKLLEEHSSWNKHLDQLLSMPEMRRF
jgi:FtsZ-binding cell division protein ZapB